MEHSEIMHTILHSDAYGIPILTFQCAQSPVDSSRICLLVGHNDHTPAFMCLFP